MALVRVRCQNIGNGTRSLADMAWLVVGAGRAARGRLFPNERDGGVLFIVLALFLAGGRTRRP